MDPVTLIAYAPTEWVPLLILVALLYKGWSTWMTSRTVKKAVAEEISKPDAEG